eukprot:COSAG01_NODE_314_length_19013_cov_164.111240_14_plen_186_part_00
MGGRCLVAGKGYTSDDDTWEPEAHLPSCREEMARFEPEAQARQLARAKSGYYGVTPGGKVGVWRARITRGHSKHIHLGTFRGAGAKEAAARAYDAAAREVFGRRASVNFPSRAVAPRKQGREAVAAAAAAAAPRCGRQASEPDRRAVTPSQPAARGSSRFHGVSWHPGKRRWTASIWSRCVNGGD